ncbi:putative Short-chain dehydrogenase reductase SDR [Rosellinia necatrix]|uniref:Putative Short-chain dehydrogenase reductase SDR n=1 Tax=Rosellinia necatrix TaxID=77044 RepID=A0A1S7UIF0_ROSNE|nr:putative Short-chain dehydrogenase reductase SDR [Rosellinia necatrix]
MASPRLWLITGASSGISLELAKIAAGRGERVIAATRSPEKLAGVTAARLDHNEPLPPIRAAVVAIVAVHGGIDVVVNNAAYVADGHGGVEETTPDGTQQQFLANAFGPIYAYQAVLPHLRSRGSGGVLVTLGSMATWLPDDRVQPVQRVEGDAAVAGWLAGWRSGSPTEEVRPFGVRHCLVEPGFFPHQARRQPRPHGCGRARLPGYDGLNSDANYPEGQ